MEDIDNNPSIYKILGNNIKKIRTKEHISQERLADLIGKSSHFISLLERGESGVAIDTLIDICKALNTDTNSVFAGIIDNSKMYNNSFLNKSFESFSDVDKDMVSYLINYINTKK